MDSTRDRSWRTLSNWVLGWLIVIVILFYTSQAILADSRGPVRLVVYAFSTQEEVLTQEIFPAFERTWEAETGRDLSLEAVFGPSGTLAAHINLGAPADVVLLSNEQHLNWLKVGRRVRWEAEPVIFGHTPMVIVTRPGNPANVAGFSDLGRPGLRLIHADPGQSGAGDWAVLAEYGSVLLETGSRDAAETQLRAIWDNVCLLAPSARAGMTLFELGAGEALVTYEQDARLAQARGVPLDIIVPERTIVAQHVAAVVDTNTTQAERRAAQAFIDFLLSEAGQSALAHYYVRPVQPEASHFTALPRPFTVIDLGGWSQAYATIVEQLWQQEIKPRLDLEPAGQLLSTNFS
ncbi:MAG TPA: extracellular solute-binding protein [Anaerolineae bacterium]|nr:extracellular solute-binding protein [Anaerolineae bacterium]